jgi:hypothetical protein
MMPSPENMRLIIATLAKRIEHKEKQARAIEQEAEARVALVRLQVPQSTCSLREDDARDAQTEAIHEEAEARVALIELDVEAYKQEKAGAERALEMMQGNLLVVPGMPRA